MNRFSSPSSPSPKQVRHGWMPGTLLIGCFLLNTLVAVPAAQRASAGTTTSRLHSAANASGPTPAFNADINYLARVSANQLPHHARVQPAKHSSAMHIAPLVPVADGRESRRHWHAAHPAASMPPVMVTVVAASAYVRGQPATDGKVVGAVFRGNKLTVLGRTNDAFWLLVDIPKFGTNTWIAASVGTLAGDLAKVPRMANAAAAPAANSVAPANRTSPSATQGSMQVYLDQPYDHAPGSNAKQLSLDLYVPQGSQKQAVIIYVHGGGWTGGDKSEVGQKSQAFTAAGYVFASVNYELLPAGAHPKNVKDLAKAISWIQKNVERFGGNPKRLFLLGYSAGAQLAALVATNESYLAAEAQPLSIIRGVVGLDGGAYDIPLMMLHYTDRNNIYALAFGPKASPIWQDASAVSYVAPGKNIAPFMLVHAQLNAFRKQQAVSLAGKLKSAGIRADLLDIPDRTHTTLGDLLGSANDRTTKAILDFYSSIN